MFKQGIWSGNKGNEETESGLFELPVRVRKAIRAENHGLSFFRKGVVKSRAENAQKQKRK